MTFRLKVSHVPVLVPDSETTDDATDFCGLTEKWRFSVVCAKLKSHGSMFFCHEPATTNHKVIHVKKYVLLLIRVFFKKFILAFIHVLYYFVVKHVNVLL